MGVSRRVQKRPISAYEKYGFVSTAERFGEHTGSDVVYLGVTSFNAKELGINVGLSLIRKIMKREGYEYTHPDCLILPNSGSLTGHGPYKIEFYYRAFGSTVPPGEDTIGVGWSFVFYDGTTAPQTLRTFANEFYNNVLRGPVFGGDGSTVNRQIHGYRLSYLDYVLPYPATDPAQFAVSNARYGNVVPLDKQYMRAYCITKVRLQNVTHADAGTAVHDRNNITANPLKGKLFRFTDRLPVLYSYTGNDHVVGQTGASSVYGPAVLASTVWKMQHDSNSDGVILYAAGPGVGADGWTRVPRETQFQNCSVCQSMYLRPGGITEFVLKFKFDGLLSKFIHGFGIGVNDKMQPVTPCGYGTCAVVALEKHMPDTAGDPKIGFSVDRDYGSIFGKRLTAIMPKWNYPSSTAIVDDA